MSAASRAYHRAAATGEEHEPGVVTSETADDYRLRLAAQRATNGARSLCQLKEAIIAEDMATS
jgi:hypothetical protein